MLPDIVFAFLIYMTLSFFCDFPFLVDFGQYVPVNWFDERCLLRLKLFVANIKKGKNNILCLYDSFFSNFLYILTDEI